MRNPLGAIAVVMLLSPAFSSTPHAQDAVGDKSAYDLFHPTPQNQLRSFSADRPSQSTGPLTVDAGHGYFETGIVSYLHDESRGSTTRQWNVLPFNFRLGLTNNIEIDLAYGSYLHERTHDSGAATEEHRGLGDVTLQAKINLKGNDGGNVAFGLIPFVKLPTNTDSLGNRSVEGGLGLPFQANLPAGLTLGLETGVNILRDSSDTGYDTAVFNAAVLSRSLGSEQLSGYVEFYSVARQGSTHAAFIDAGLVYQLLANAEIDVGCNFGITSAAPDFQPFTGFSFRF